MCAQVLLLLERSLVSADMAPCLRYPLLFIVGMQINGSVPHLPYG